MTWYFRVFCFWAGRGAASSPLAGWRADPPFAGTWRAISEKNRSKTHGIAPGGLLPLRPDPVPGNSVARSGEGDSNTAPLAMKGEEKGPEARPGKAPGGAALIPPS